MELVPQPLSYLLRRVDKEPAATGGALFDLKAHWQGTPKDQDFSRTFHGERAANVVGPAAGPHTQLAQNIALSYLAGSRILELKTVQIMDELKIPRPCIDAQNIGFNVEWSQELKIEQSTVEYAKAALLIAALQKKGLPEGLPAEDQDYLLDLSLGYDLKGIQHERVTGFVKHMLDAEEITGRLLSELPDDLAHYKDLSVTKRLISCVTLSTFHGCPANEIELIARYLLEEVGVHVVVKLNPTLLGFEEVQGILHDGLGYHELELNRASFKHDLQWGDALSMIERLRKTAAERDLTFGVKLTNTLVVKNHKRFFPASEKEMYLSGQPLHVLSTQLLAKLRAALPVLMTFDEMTAPPVVYSFSAGIDQHNFPMAAAADLCPVTTCTDLLRPGGYGRLPKYLNNLTKAMNKTGASTLEDHIVRFSEDPAKMLEDTADLILRQAKDEPLTKSQLLNLAKSEQPLRETVKALGLSDDLTQLIGDLWVHQAGTHNAGQLARAALSDRRYHNEKNSRVPKKIGSKLELFDCINCDKCVPVCPNNANFVYYVAPLVTEAPVWRFDGDQVEEVDRLKLDIEEEHQLATFVDFCNGCGNCDVFCPEDGGPYVIKPHWFQNADSFEAEPTLDGFYLESSKVIVGRIQGRKVRLDQSEEIAIFEDEFVQLRVRLGPPVQLEGHQSKSASAHRVEGGHLLIMASLMAGALSTVNPVSAAFS